MPHPLKLTLPAIITLVTVFGAAAAQAAEKLPSMTEMWETLKQQQQLIESLKQQQQTTDAKVESTADAVDARAQHLGSGVVMGGYAEHHFNNPQGGKDIIDAHRFVLLMGHSYSDSVKVFAELELEHSLAGEGKPGEVELEQAYVQWQYADQHRATMGLFLVPVGIINETHEPDTFYGVERNSVEKDIIPATWWETGGMLSGAIAPGFSYDLAVHSGLKTTAKDGIRKGRQKSAEATAETFAYTARLKYTGLPGLELATSLQYQADLNQDQTSQGEAGTLWETHAIYQTGPFALRALYAAWQIDGASYEALGTDTQTGLYVEPSYKITDRLGVFSRYSVWNTQGANDAAEKEAVDVGVNFWLVERVVLKADYQYALTTTLTDSINLGIGWSF